MNAINKYKTQHSKIGNVMYNILFTVSSFLIKHRWLYIILNYTWGIITAFIGLIVSLILLCTKHNPIRFYSTWYFQIYTSWGGLELGQCFIRDTTSNNSINYHEYGHTYQNAILGPFFIFVVWLPSAIRYWYQRIRQSKNKNNKPYDLIWFEGNASEIGEVAANYDIQHKGE